MTPRPRERRDGPAGTAVRAVLAALVCAPFAVAQTPTVTAGIAMGGGTPPFAASLRIGVADLRRAGAVLDVATVLGPTVGLDAAARYATAFGPLGTGTVEGGVGVRADRSGPVAWAGGATVRGGLGPVAGRVAVTHRDGEARPLRGAWGVHPPAIGPTADATRFGPAPVAMGVRAGDRLTSVAAHVDGRLPGGVVLAVGALREVGSAGAAWGADVGVRVRRAVRRDVDLRTHVTARTETADDADPRAVGVGIGVTQRPRRAPERTVRAWLDVARAGGATRVRPGLDAVWVGRVGAGDATVQLRARPSGPTPTPWRASVSWRHDRGATAWTWTGDVARAANAVAGRLEVRAAVPWPALRDAFGR